MPRYEVIGEDGNVYELSGDVLGSVLGEDDDDDEGYVGSAVKRRHMKRVNVEEASWRRRQLAPGVQAPDQGMYPLALEPSNGTGIFGVGVPEITFRGQLQKPFRGERLLVRVVRTGTTATGTLLGQLFVGTDLQAASIRGVNIENIGRVDGFGVRLTMVPAQPGVLISLIVRPTVIPTTTDTIAVDVEILGRIVA